VDPGLGGTGGNGVSGDPPFVLGPLYVTHRGRCRGSVSMTATAEQIVFVSAKPRTTGRAPWLAV